MISAAKARSIASGSEYDWLRCNKELRNIDIRIHEAARNGSYFLKYKINTWDWVGHHELEKHRKPATYKYIIQKLKEKGYKVSVQSGYYIPKLYFLLLEDYRNGRSLRNPDYPIHEDDYLFINWGKENEND